MAVHVTQADVADRAAACRLLASARPGPLQEEAALRYQSLLSSGEFDPAGLFVARDRYGGLHGAMLVQPLAGALGLAWPPRGLSRPDQHRIEDELVSVALGWLRGRGVKVCQAFGAEADRGNFTALERNGFRRITSVTYRRRAIDRNNDRFDSTRSPLTFEAFNPDHREQIASVVLATYDGSLDCPELTGSRSNEELLAGFSGVLSPCPRWWFVARHDTEAVGVILLEVGTEPGALDLSYLGLIPGVRGRGWSHSMARYAIGFAAAEENSTLTLSVDVRNEPALRLYARHGFREYDRRDVYLLSWS